jgi:hypothetical protein
VENNIKMNLRELKCEDMVLDCSTGGEVGNKLSDSTGGGSFLTV